MSSIPNTAATATPASVTTSVTTGVTNAGSASQPTLMADLVVLFKVRIGVMVAIITMIGFLVGWQSLSTAAGASAGGASVELPWFDVFALLLGVTLAAMGSSSLNQAIEADTDALMDRTEDRPVASGRVQAGTATGAGLALALISVSLLAITVGPLPTALCALTIASYVWVYTPMKRVSSLATIVGAVPGALPPVIGYAAATGRLDIHVAVLFAIMFLWQLPHFLAIAWLYRDDYGRAGIPVLPVEDPSGRSTFRQMLLGSLALLPLGLLPTMMGQAGVIYFFGALLAGAIYLGFNVALVIGRSSRHARRAFYASLVYLPTVFGLLAWDSM